jgi:5-methylcytosine-specific restriction protein A
MTRNPTWKRDELILALDLYFKVNPSHVSQSHPEIIALSALLNTLPIHSKDLQQTSFRNANGVYMKLCNFLRFDPDYHGSGLKAGAKLEEAIWSEFSTDKGLLSKVATAIKENAPSLAPLDQETEVEEEFPEGSVLTRTHRMRERNSTAIKKKKEHVQKSTGRLACTVCGFDFEDVYGAIGAGFAECHHNIPVSELKPNQSTKLADLSIVCSNCHRMIHRAKPWLSITQLKSKIGA